MSYFEARLPASRGKKYGKIIRSFIGVDLSDSHHCCGIKTLKHFNTRLELNRDSEWGTQTFDLEDQDRDYIYLLLLKKIKEYNYDSRLVFQFSDCTGKDDRRDGHGGHQVLHNQINFYDFATWCGFKPHTVFMNPNTNNEVGVFNQSKGDFNEAYADKLKWYKEKYNVKRVG